MSFRPEWLILFDTATNPKPGIADISAPSAASDSKHTIQARPAARDASRTGCTDRKDGRNILVEGEPFRMEGLGKQMGQKVAFRSTTARGGETRFR